MTYDLLRHCEPPDQNRGIELAQRVCLNAIPSLNDSRETEIVAMVAVMTVVSTIAVILRLLGRRISAAPYGVDDFFIIVALILTYGLNMNEIVAVHYGFGKHQLMLSLDHIEKFLLNDWTIQILFATAISVTRMSLLVFYHRLFPVKRFTIVAIVTGSTKKRKQKPAAVSGRSANFARNLTTVLVPVLETQICIIPTKPTARACVIPRRLTLNTIAATATFTPIALGLNPTAPTHPNPILSS
ncbi:MAG: hypothetical protein L6R39_007558 [Caloplaca ligustica]|nr:MAG: hypothetical protein L6R39_007558 [Caloplaca ligustica]